MSIRFFILLAFALPSLSSLAQGQKEVYGSFEAGCKVYNYHFKQASNGINGFTVTRIGQEFQLFGLEQKKLDTTLVFFDSTVKKLERSITDSSLSDSARKAMTYLKTAVSALKVLTAEVSNKVNGMQTLTQRSGEVDSFIKKSAQLHYDTVLRNFYGREPSSNFYAVSNILSSINDLLVLLKGKEPAKYTYFNEFRQDVFENVFKSYMKPYEPFSSICPTDLNRLASQVFGSIKARLDFFDDEPVTAYLRLKGKKIRVYIRNEDTDPSRQREKTLLKENKRKDKSEERDSYISQRRLYEWTDYLNFEVDNVAVEFEDGNIKNVFADLTFINKAGERDIQVRFRNNIPISVSNKFDPDIFENNRIFASIPCEVYRLVRNRGVSTSGSNQLSDVNSKTNCRDLFFLLSDLLQYLVVAENDKEDYSPANKVYELNEQTPVQQLKKEKRSKILVVKAYSDFIGIRDDQPNGLIQFEGSKKINILTRRSKSHRKNEYYLTRNNRNTRNNYHGFLTYIEPRIIFSKLERNNKYLYLDRSTLDTVRVFKQGIKGFHVDPLQLYQYSNFSLQTDFNLYKFNWANGKSNFQLNARYGYMRTGISDSVNVVDSAAVAAPDLKTDNINSRGIGLSLVWEFKPDSRYGITLGYELQHIKPYSDQYSIGDGFNRLIQTFYFDGYLNTNNDGGRLFFRTRFNQLMNKWNRNFMQVQLGYSMNIFKVQ